MSWKSKIRPLLRCNAGEICEEQTTFTLPDQTPKVTEDGEQIEVDEETEVKNKISRQILLDLSSVNRNVVTMWPRVSQKLTKKSALVSSLDIDLLTEPVGIRQFVGLTHWNQIIRRDLISRQDFKDSDLIPKY